MSIEFTSHILNLPHDRQHRYWGGPRPWFFKGNKVRLPRGDRLTSRDVTVTGAGAVVRIARTVERPCFGSPTAFLLHGGEEWILTKAGEKFPSHCNTKNCPAAEACAHVARQRLRANDEIREAYEAFVCAGDRAELKRLRKEKRVGRATQAWGRLLHALDRHGSFPCVNTNLLRDQTVARLANTLRKDAERKRQERLAQRQARICAGADDEPFLRQLLLETNLRTLSFEHARVQRNAPAWIKRCGNEGAEFTAEVWRAKMLVTARGRKPNPTSVTRQMVTNGLIEPHRENAQRNGRVKEALARAHRLETIDWSGGGPTWEPLSVDALLEASASPPSPANDVAPISLIAPCTPLQSAA